MSFLNEELTLEFFNAFALQMWMIVVAMSLAIIIGIPLAIMALRYPWLKKFILSSTGVLQVIPSLALLAFLIPIVGIGLKPAVIAIFLYALLPIVSNTLSGVENIPAASKEAADALGFTDWQRLRLVELPLALPYIINGIRVAAVITVGTATLAAFVGAGGLGDFINRGLALNSTKLLLLGAIPAAVLTLMLDFLIYQIEKILKLSQRSKIAKRNIYWFIVLTALIFLTPTTYFLLNFLHTQNDKTTIRIATKNFTEQFILGEILKQLIENRTRLKVKLYSNLGSGEICLQALRNHQIDLYPEYTDIALLSQIHQLYVGAPREVVFKRAQQEYHRAKF